MTRTMQVRDVMETDVVTVHPGMSVRELTRILSDYEISGAPVVDDRGETVGVVSSTDVLRLSAEELGVHSTREFSEEPWEDEEEGPPSSESGDDEGDLVDYFMAGDAPTLLRYSTLDETREGPLDQFTVQDIMTPATFTVEPDNSVRELAEFLLRGRIHRALVMEDGVLKGIVTSFDVLQAVLERE